VKAGNYACEMDPLSIIAGTIVSEILFQIVPSHQVDSRDTDIFTHLDHPIGYLRCCRPSTRGGKENL
jgi:hypothetical protein